MKKGEEVRWPRGLVIDRPPKGDCFFAMRSTPICGWRGPMPTGHATRRLDGPLAAVHEPRRKAPLRVRRGAMQADDSFEVAFSIRSTSCRELLLNCCASTGGLQSTECRIKSENTEYRNK
eukprot:4149527-Pleurochrysis_carterae.AAC.1